MNSSGDNIYVYIIPVETDENVVNQIILHIDYNKAENEIYSRDIHQHLCEAVNNNITVEYANDTDSLKFSENNSYRETGIDIEKMKLKN